MIAIDGGTKACSGAIANNAREDMAPYLMTVAHCMLGPFGDWFTYFNYQSPLVDTTDCDSTIEGTDLQPVVGATIKASAEIIDSDYALLLLTETIPSSHNVFFAGWYSVDSAADSTVSIHHPAGDIKKISFHDSSPFSSGGTPGLGGVSHWQVTYHPNQGTLYLSRRPNRHNTDSPAAATLRLIC